MDFLANMFGGDMGAAMMRGMQMAQMEEQMQLNQERFKQEAANARLLNEERALKIKGLRQRMASRDKIIGQIMPQTTARTENVDLGLLDTDQTTTTTQETLFSKALAKLLGADRFEAIRQTVALDPDLGYKMLEGAKPEGLNEVGLLSMSPNDPRRQNFIQGKQEMQELKSPNEIELQKRALKGDTEAKAILDAIEERKARMNRAGQGGFGSNPQDVQDTWFEQYRLTGKLPPMAYRDSESRTQFIRGYADYLKRNGASATDAAVTKASMDSLKSSLTQQEKSHGMAGSFVTNINGQINKVERIMQDTINRVGARALDVPIRELKVRFAGSGQERVLESYLMEISREIGKLSTGSQASIAELSVEAQKKWDKIHDPNLSFNDLKQVLEATREQANIRMESLKGQINLTRNEMKGLTGNRVSGNNNPLNIKYGGETKKWVDTGAASQGTQATDGGYFLKFNTPQGGMEAAKDLLFNSGIYSSLSVNDAMKKWSNGGYDGKIALGLAPRKVATLNESEKNTLVQAMLKAEGNGSMSGITPSQQPEVTPKIRRGAEFNKNVAYMKMARNREEAKAKLAALKAQGWSIDEAREIARAAGWD